MSSRSTRSTYKAGKRQGRTAKYKPGGMTKPGSSPRMLGDLKAQVGRVSALQNKFNQRDKAGFREAPQRLTVNKVQGQAGTLAQRMIDVAKRVAPERGGVVTPKPTGGPSEQVAARKPRVRRPTSFGRGGTRSRY